MTEPEPDIAQLERQLADLAVPGGMPLEVLLKLAEVVFPDRRGIGDPSRTVWPESGREKESRAARDATLSTRDRLVSQIRQSEIRFRSLVEQLPAVVFYAALGQDDNEVYISPQIEALLGFTQDEWLTNPLLWYSQLHPDDHDIVIDAFTRGVQTGGPFQARVRFLSREGKVVWIHGEAHLMFDEDHRPAYFQGVAFDITLAKEAEEVIAQAERAKAEAAHVRAESLVARNLELTRLNELLRLATEQAHDAAAARSTFLTTMSHELRTPLNSVIVLSGLLADGDLSPGQADMVRTLQLASDHLLEVINEILEFSRLRAGHVELDNKTFDLGRWIDDTLEIVGPRAAEKNIELRYRLLGGVPRRLTTDEGRLRQILLNLVGNAVKFTPRGHVEVTVTAQAAPGRGGSWEFEGTVLDTGVGVRPEVAAALFEEFRQADSGIAREFGGTGLGLAICQRLCELLGGRIWIDQDQDRAPAETGADGLGPGAVFKFTWVAQADPTSIDPNESRGGRRPPPSAAIGSMNRQPPREQSGRGASSPSPAPADRSVPDGGLNILLVEDDPMNQEVALLLLHALGYRADVVSSGRAALSAVSQRPYDVVFMDVAMPGMDGLSATRAMRAFGAAIRQPHVVALTANALPGDLETCLEAGMDAYVAKPIDRARLAQILATVTAEFDRSVPQRIWQEYGPEPLLKLLHLFRTESEMLSRSAAAAVATGDAPGAMRAAHTLKSAAATVGASSLAAACAELESSARRGSLDGADRLVALMARRLDVALDHVGHIERELPS